MNFNEQEANEFLDIAISDLSTNKLEGTWSGTPYSFSYTITDSTTRDDIITFIQTQAK